MALADEGAGRTKVALGVPPDQELRQLDLEQFAFLLARRKHQQTELHERTSSR